jgi:hypothetical protein
VLPGGIDLPAGLGSRPGPAVVAVVWTREPDPGAELARRVTSLPPSAIVLTNAPVAADTPRLVLGAERMRALVDADPRLRLRVPSVLGDELGAVFVPTRAYDAAVDVLERHHFAVLTGPPEMGKTAIARMVASAMASDGWEVHDCHGADDVRRAFAADRRQLFVADDAFGSTEYRPDAAERWARELPEVLRMVGETHWLIWTSRPAPLHAGLRRVHQERGGERFPSPAQVQVDAGELDIDEKASILLRHAKAAGLAGALRQVVRRDAPRIVGHPHFTPERLRRLVAAAPTADGRLDELADAILSTPTEAMATSLDALEPEHRDLLVALLDTPPGPASERDLAASLRRHHRGGLQHAPGDLVDRLADHFLRVVP